jgi:type III pantothenate kinase
VESLLSERTDYYLRVEHTTPMPIRNLYATPHTLGIDRLAAAVGAMEIYPKCNILVADLGTAVTIDFVSAAGEFVGGNITLGAAGRFRALNDYTAGLPLVSLDDEVEAIGSDTVSAIRSGVVNGITYELEGYIARAEAKFEDLRIIFTGGDANYFAKRLKNAIFATGDLVVFGLNTILEYNAKN